MSLHGSSPDPLELSPGEDSVSTLLASRCLQCPLSEAPGCFKAVLVRSLEPGEGNFIPTNWRGFSDYFSLQTAGARSAEEVVGAWASGHPYRHEHTLGKVVEYARSTGHRKLLNSLVLALKDHLLPGESWTDDPASCFHTCHCCVPLARTNSRSFEDLHSPSKHQHHHTASTSSLPPHHHRRTHSLPKNIEIGQGSRPPHPPLAHTAGSSVTNIFMSCNCRNSPFTPPATSPFPPSAAWTSTLASPTSALTTTTLPSSPVQSAALHSHRHMSTPEPVSTTGQRDHTDSPQSAGVPETEVLRGEKRGPSEGARRRHSSQSQDPQPQRGLRRQPPTFPLYTSRSGAQLPSPSPSPLRQQTPTPAESSAGGVNTVNVEESLPQNPKNESRDIMYEFGCKLFDTAPYNLVRKFYNRSTREVIILVLACFFLYNGFRCVLQTMCENGGFRKVFMEPESTLDEGTRRIAILLLRILTVVISPLCLCVHISPIALKPRVPRTTFSLEAAIKRMVCVHRNFSPHYEVSFIQAEPQRVFQVSEAMTKRHIKSIWMSVLNSLLFASLLSYIGGVRLSTRGFTEGGVCQFLTATIVHLPLLSNAIHAMMFLDLFLMLGVLVSIHMLKDYYYYENRIAVFAVTVGGEAEGLYQEIRQRWALLDLYCYTTAVAISIGSFTLVSVKRTLIPDPSAPLRPEHLLNWCFWISVLTVVCCLGLSSNRLVKKSTFPAYIFIAFLLQVVNLDIDTIPPESLEVFYLIGGSAMVVNLLLSLCSCHHYHYRHTESRGSLFLLLLSLALMAILSAAVSWTLYRETVHLAAFVQW